MAYSRADCDRSWVNMEGAQIVIGDGVGPPLSVGCDQSWPSLGPPPPPTPQKKKQQWQKFLILQATQIVLNLLLFKDTMLQHLCPEGNAHVKCTEFFVCFVLFLMALLCNFCC